MTSMYRVFSCVARRGGLLWPVCSLGKTLLAFVIVLKGQICLLLQISVDFLFLHFSPLWWKGHFFWYSSKRSYRSSSVQFSSVAQSYLTLCYPMNCSTPGLPVHHQLPEFTQTYVHRVGDAIQPSHLSSPSPPALNPSQQQSLFQWVNSSHEVAKVLEFQL